MERHRKKGRMKKRESRLERGIGIFMAVFLLLGSIGTMGCGGEGNVGADTGSGSDVGTAGDRDGGEKGNGGGEGEDGMDGKVMGRYVESVDESLAGLLSSNCRIVCKSDGSLVIATANNGQWVSQDNGASWEQEVPEWFSGLKEKASYIMDIAVSKDGTVGVIYEEEGDGDAGGVLAGEEDGAIGDVSAGDGGGAAGDVSAGDGGGVAGDVLAGIENGVAGDVLAGVGDGATGDISVGVEDGAAGDVQAGNKDGVAGNLKEEDRVGSAGGAQTGGKDASDGKGQAGNGDTVVDLADGDGAEEDSSGWPEGFSLEVHPKYMVVSPDNEVTEFEIPYDPEGYLRKLYFSEDGRLFASALGGKMYEIDWEQGNYKVVAELDEWASHFRVWEDRMVCVTWKGVYLYDLSAGEIVPDKALDEFVEMQLKEKLEGSDGYYQPLLVVPEGDDVLYLICEKGIFRHVWGGNLVEQLADGSLNSLGDPSSAISDGLLLADGTFLLMVGSGRLVSYAYDPDMPATPDMKLKAYSLTENNRLKKAIASYQAGHPEVYVQYEIGMEGDGSATREDALKKLNTEIAAGNGPDLLLLDDMPMESYVEKGILADLSPYLEKKRGEGYFQNILRAFEAEGKVYAVPTEFRIPLIGGRAEDVAKMGDLASIAQVAGRYREEKPEGGIFGIVQEKNMIKAFLPVCAPVWVKGDGSIDGEELERFFTQMQRIWEAEQQGLAEGQRDVEEDYIRMMLESGFTEEEADETVLYSVGWTGENYMVGEREFFMGNIEGSFDFDMMCSYFRVKGRSDGGFAAYGGQVSGVFIPYTIVGISQASEHQDMAGELMEVLIDVDWGNLMANKGTFKEALGINATEDGGSYGCMVSEREDGTEVFFEIYPASEEEIRRLVQIVEQVKVPYRKNRVLETAVCDVGEKVLKGEMTAKEGAQDVVERVSIYMAE